MESGKMYHLSLVISMPFCSLGQTTQCMEDWNFVPNRELLYSFKYLLGVVASFELSLDILKVNIGFVSSIFMTLLSIFTFLPERIPLTMSCLEKDRLKGHCSSHVICQCKVNHVL